MASVSSREFFGKFDGEQFESYEDLERKVIAEFNRRLGEFPPNYDHREMIMWGRVNRWIVPIGDGKFRIQVENNSNVTHNLHDVHQVTQ